MLYNTGALKDPNTYNSILHIADVKPYLRKPHIRFLSTMHILFMVGV